VSPRPRRTKIAVLGGGVAGLTAAFELTATPELQARYEVTVYQLGWRLGGKGSSGRNARHGQRIEEHGLHIWFGFYDNAFSLMKLCYEELGRAPGTPLATWDEAFFPCNDVVLYERWGDRWVARKLAFPDNPLTPGESAPISFAGLVVEALDRLRREWERLSSRVLDEPVVPIRPYLPARWRQGKAQLLELAERRAENVLRHMPLFGVDLAIPRLLDEFRDWLWEAVVEDRVDDDEVRFFFMAYDFVAGMISGIYRDRLLQRGFGVINDEELSAWLERHGVTRLTIEHFPLLRAFYSLVFGFEDGDPERPNVAAGKAIQAYLRIGGCYKGSVLWKMRAGMGDAVFAPLYEVLRRRGVQFRFFHAVTGLRLSRDRRYLSSIVVQPQVELSGPDGEYHPLVDVKGLPCWPNEPHWRQITGGAALRRRGADLEEEVDVAGLAPLVLRRGRQFDAAVLAIPVGALAPICLELASDPTNPRFGRMLANAHTVATQAFQLWLNRPIDELGWSYGDNTAMSSYTEPLDTYCDMSHLIDVESWRGAQTGSIAYFCGVLPDAAATTEAGADGTAREHAVRYINHSIGAVWPGAVTPDGHFEWKLLVDDQDRSGEARFDSQYWRANTSGSERYVTTPAGSVVHRLRADESGYPNLVLAGDWTRNGIDGGSVEAAVTSGRQAARAICGEPKFIPGETGILERD
jgi:uncharacterized protein with NAD-binding domain and iron-sulfur cluster